MIKYHLKKRIDIVVEAPLTRTLTSTLDQARVPGYSVLPILEGRGMLNAWSSDGQISDAANMVALLCIVDAAQHAPRLDLERRMSCADCPAAGVVSLLGWSLQNYYVVRNANLKAGVPSEVHLKPLIPGNADIATPEISAQSQTRQSDYVCVTSAYLPTTAV